jgi:hypothetical protein
MGDVSKAWLLAGCPVRGRVAGGGAGLQSYVLACKCQGGSESGCASPLNLAWLLLRPSAYPAAMLEQGKHTP